MESRLRSNYFCIVKFISITGLVFFGMTQQDTALWERAWMFLIGAVFLLCSVMMETDDSGRRKIWLSGEGISALLSVFLFPVCGLFFIAITYLDIIGTMGSGYYAVCWAPALGAKHTGMSLGAAFAIMTLIMLIYWQHNKIVNWYSDAVEQDIRNESRLMSDMAQTGEQHRDELRRSRLASENELLEEKARISQALHDKLGHSINGSVYKLEAAKVLIDKKPDESTRILQEVIDNLRGSMDEIRVIIRNERPDKAKSAAKALRSLCDECEQEYGIDTELVIEQEGREIPEKIWDVILDNAYEAVTNSLKYSGCSRLSIRITALGEVVRCTISDNGRGASEITDGMGIQGMKQRVRNVRGYFDIESQGGFTINMILPIKQERIQ